jgi:predicted AAA+ superfamily ATPase
MTKRKPLIIRGARQVGKSTLVNLLASKLKMDLCVVNFEKNPKSAEFFKSNVPKTILELLSLELKQSIIPGKSILFLDEIQAAPQVIS